jgi:anti-anti-sigma factor
MSRPSAKSGSGSQISRDGTSQVTVYGPLEIESRQRGEGGWLVEVRGEVDFATIGTLRAELEKRAAWPIVLDLSHVEFMDSTGILLLVQTAGRLMVGGVSPPVERLIRLCGIETELKYTT